MDIDYEIVIVIHTCVQSCFAIFTAHFTDVSALTVCTDRVVYTLSYTIYANKISMSEVHPKLTVTNIPLD